MNCSSNCHCSYNNVRCKSILTLCNFFLVSAIRLASSSLVRDVSEFDFCCLAALTNDAFRVTEELVFIRYCDDIDDLFKGDSSSAPLRLSNVDCKYFSRVTIWSSDSKLAVKRDIGFLSVFSPLGVETWKENNQLWKPTAESYSYIIVSVIGILTSRNRCRRLDRGRYFFPAPLRFPQLISVDVCDLKFTITKNSRSMMTEVA